MATGLDPRASNAPVKVKGRWPSDKCQPISLRPTTATASSTDLWRPMERVAKFNGLKVNG